MAEQIEKTRLAGLENMFSSDSSDEEEDNVEDGPDIFADDMALGEDASTLESQASKNGEKKTKKVPAVIANKGLRTPIQRRKKQRKDKHYIKKPSSTKNI